MQYFKKDISLFFCAAILFTASCEKDSNTTEDPNQAPRLTQKVNDFIFDFMDDVYLWTSEMPKNIDRKYEMDSKVYFDKLLYKAEDKWSYITDDYEKTSQGSEGVETTFGYSVVFGRFTGTINRFGIVQFVYPNTPAANAGLKRGDILVKINGVNIDDNNYMQVFNNETLSIQLGVLSNGSISGGATVNLTAVKMQLSAIIEKKVFAMQGKKIGYLFYSDFFGGSETELDQVFIEFKTAGIQDIVLDLRCNLGGYGYVATHLASILAPATVVSEEKVMITYQWNAEYQAYWQQQGQLDRLRTLFKKDVPVNMNLSRVYVLAGYNTASASEFVITGLDPYMDVIKIGESTRGKYTGSILYQAQYYNGTKWVVDQEIKNWGIQPIIERYANSLGVTDFKEGFKPDYEVDDLLMEGVQALGDPKEPLLGKALELITGIPATITPQTKKSSFELIKTAPIRNDYFNGSVLRK